MNIILNIQITSEAWVEQQDIEIYFPLEKNWKQEETEDYWIYIGSPGIPICLL